MGLVTNLSHKWLWWHHAFIVPHSAGYDRPHRRGWRAPSKQMKRTTNLIRPRCWGYEPTRPPGTVRHLRMLLVIRPRFWGYDPTHPPGTVRHLRVLLGSHSERSASNDLGPLDGLQLGFVGLAFPLVRWVWPTSWFTVGFGFGLRCCWGLPLVWGLMLVVSSDCDGRPSIPNGRPARLAEHLARRVDGAKPITRHSLRGTPGMTAQVRRSRAPSPAA